MDFIKSEFKVIFELMHEVMSIFILKLNNFHSFYRKATDHHPIPKSPVFP